MATTAQTLLILIMSGLFVIMLNSLACESFSIPIPASQPAAQPSQPSPPPAQAACLERAPGPAGCPDGYVASGTTCQHCPPSPACRYVLRTYVNNAWTCPASTFDTGLSWDSGPALGKKQCEKCSPDASQCSYVLRENKGGAWVCPDGTDDTGTSWEAGPVDGAKQCEKCS